MPAPHRPSRAAGAPVAALVTAVVAAVCTALVAPASPAAAADTVQLSATVTNTDGVPQNGTICLELVGSGSCGGTSLVNGSWARTWTEGVNDPGDYLVQVRSSTMDGTVRWYVAGDPDGSALKADATVVTLGVGAPDLAFDMVMPAIAKVAGRVVDTGGQGVPGLAVLLNQLGQVRGTTTDADGDYDLGYTRAGSWQLSVDGGPTYAGTQTGVVVPATGLLTVPDLVVTLPAEISGVVTDSVTGLPVPLIQVSALGASSPHPYLNGAVTDALGRYRIDDLGTAPLVLKLSDDAFSGYQAALNGGGDPVDFDPQTPLTLTEEEQRTLDLTITPEVAPSPPTHNLAGTVTDDQGRPLPGIIATFGGLSDTTDRLGRWFLDVPDGPGPVTFTPEPVWVPAFPGEPSWAPTSIPATVSGGVGPTDLEVTVVRLVSNTSAPTVTGTPRVGQTLTASPGTWVSPTGTTFTTTWLRDGVAVSTGASRLLTPADAGRQLTARVTGAFGGAVTTATAAPRTVARLASSTTARGRSTKPGRVRITIRVTAAGLTPSGTVDVLRRGTVVRRDVPLVGGRATVVLRRQPDGRTRYAAAYDGAAQTLPSRSARFTVAVL